MFRKVLGGAGDIVPMFRQMLINLRTRFQHTDGKLKKIQHALAISTEITDKIEVFPKDRLLPVIIDHRLMMLHLLDKTQSFYFFGNKHFFITIKKIIRILQLHFSLSFLKKIDSGVPDYQNTASMSTPFLTHGRLPQELTVAMVAAMRFIFTLLALLLLTFAPAWADTVTNLRLFQIAGTATTRLTLTIDRQVPYRAFVLNNPMRVVVDLPLLNWQAPMNKGDRTGRIRSYRQSVFQKDTRRLVLDLNKPMIVTAHGRDSAADGRGWDYYFDLQSAAAMQFQQAIGRVSVGGGAPQTATHGTEQTLQLRNAIPAMEISPVLTAPAKKKIPLIVIDAGHGGVDVGAIASTGVYEKNITLAIAKRLRDTLLSTGHYRVHLTRDRDIFIKLPQRVAIARRMSADMFVSLHADTIMRPGVQGASVYTLSETASDAETAKLAERENAVDTLVNVDVGDVEEDVADILIDLVTRDTMNQSKVLAGNVVKTFYKHGIRTLPQRPHRSAGFAVLKAPDIPSILIEMGYLSNRAEANRLTTAAHQQRLADAITATIDQFFSDSQ